MQNYSDSRIEREKRAYDAQNVHKISAAWFNRGSHIFKCPNTMRHERTFEELIKKGIKEKKSLRSAADQATFLKRYSPMEPTTY